MSPEAIHDILGLDLLLEILDFLAVPLAYHQRTCDLSVLASCSLVCRTWSPHAQTLLFRRVILPNNIYRSPHLRGTTRNMLPSFLSALDPETEKGRWLAGCVRSLTLRHTGRERSSDASALAETLMRTTNLRHLDVTTASCNFSADTLARLTADGPKITSLSILQEFSPFTPQHMSIMHRLVNALPTIRILEISSNLTGSLPPFDPRPALGLVVVRFNTLMVRDVGPCLESLLRQGEDTLEVLYHKSKGGHPSMLDDVLARHGAYLRSLSIKTLPLADPGDSLDPLDPLAHCTRLERFELGHFPDKRTLEVIPRSITALAIAGVPAAWDLDGGVDGLVDVLPLFPQLKTLTWRLREYGVPEVLEKACRERGVEVRLLSGAHEHDDDNMVEVDVRRRWLRI
ncbi:hypothetical protein C8F01DRAFT_672210 [Mycena amicta]|nr:hypothetical protein C8F01DRAFT_672210 [Mycena amicta]